MTLDGLANKMFCDLQFNLLCDERIGKEFLTNCPLPAQSHLVIETSPNMNSQPRAIWQLWLYLL